MAVYEAVSEFHPRTWEEHGMMEKIPAEVDDEGYMIPTYKILNPGGVTTKGMFYMYLIGYGFIEDDMMDTPPGVKPKLRTMACFPLGVGKTSSHPEELLKDLVQLHVTVRRTAGSTEKLVYFAQGSLNHLTPWAKVLKNGAIFEASKVCNNIEAVLLNKKQRLRMFFLIVTLLVDDGVYKVPKTMLDMRENNAISLNIMVTLKLDADLGKVGLRGIIDEDGEKVTTFMVHIGNFIRKAGKMYSAEYCRQKVDRMRLTFALGGVGGLSLHIKVNGKMSKRLYSQLGFHKSICYSLMDTNPRLNRLTWNHECIIKKITAVFQPSAPKSFRIYDDVLIDDTGKILKH